MYQTVRAVYRAGTFILQEALDVPEGSEVELTVQGPLMLMPEITDPMEQARLLKVITRRMRQNPIPVGAPRLTREELHARS
jgi:predicted DNA-binding antitoxin AbrB/MazE fold protein